MKRNLLLLTLTAAAIILTLSSYMSGPAANGQGNISAVGCAGSTCHGNTNNNSTVVGIVFVDKVTGQVVSNFKYIPGRLYTVYLIANNSNGVTKFGFQLTSVKKLALTSQAGTFSNWPASGLVHRQIISGVEVMEHGTTLVGKLVGTTGLDTVKMDWTAPASTAGSVRFYYSMNCVNGNGSADAGDQWNNSFTDLDVDNTGVVDLDQAIISTLFPNPVKDVLNLSIKKAGTYKVSVLDISGKLVYSSEVISNSSADPIRIPTEGLKAGNYLLRISGNKTAETLCFIKQ